jgi:hypothetical protein
MSIRIFAAATRCGTHFQAGWGFRPLYEVR